MNKIISMSVWGNNPRYIEGARIQSELAFLFYPSWKVKIFVDNPHNFKDFPFNTEIIQADTSTYGMFWRFQPLFEDENNIVIVRDADSRITLREQRAVHEWIDSDFKFHTFKDHEAHYEFPIIGCAFGYKGKLPSELQKTMVQYSKSCQYYLSDQNFLRDYVYYLVKDSELVHGLHGGWFSETRKTLRNPYSFCGNGYDENDMPLYAPTLKECEGFDPSKLDKKYKFDLGVYE